jgi:hypothetical protein
MCPTHTQLKDGDIVLKLNFKFSSTTVFLMTDCILFSLHFVVFKQTVCHLTAEANVEQVFSLEG